MKNNRNNRIAIQLFILSLIQSVLAFENVVLTIYIYSLIVVSNWNKEFQTMSLNFVYMWACVCDFWAYLWTIKCFLLNTHLWLPNKYITLIQLWGILQTIPQSYSFLREKIINALNGTQNRWKSLLLQWQLFTLCLKDKQSQHSGSRKFLWTLQE